MMKRAPRRFWFAIFLVTALVLAAAAVLALDWPPLVAWLSAANVAAALVWALDKGRAARGARRVPEVVLHLMAVLGAAPASLVAMYALRHKTRRPAFLVLYVLVLIAQGAAAWLWWRDRG